MVKIRENAQAPAIAWPSWQAWRHGHRAPESVWFRDLTRPATADWCLTCWGNGRIYAAAPNGEGLIPVRVCMACAGTGRT